MAAHRVAGTEATKEAMLISAFPEDIGQKIDGPIKLHGDNQGANSLAANPEYHGRTKHIHGRQRFISEIVEKRFIEVECIPMKEIVVSRRID